MKGSDTGGVKPMPIAGRYVRERERLLGMTDEERKWRAQWLKDQHLSHSEPKPVPELYFEQYNFFQRLYRAPLDKAAAALEPTVGKRIYKIRYFTGKALMALFGSMAAIYYFKYNAHDWTRVGGWRALEARRVVLPGDPGWPHVEERKPSDYADNGFSKVKLKL